MKFERYTPAALDSAEIISVIHRLPEGDLKQRLWKLLDRWGKKLVGSDDPDWIEAQAYLNQHQIQFFAVCPNHWGMDLTEEDAIKQARSAGAHGRRRADFTIVRLEKTGHEPIEYSVCNLTGALQVDEQTTATVIQKSRLAIA